MNETIPDGSKFSKDTKFSKLWTLRNTGTCTWPPDYKLVFISGDQMEGPNVVKLGEYVAPWDLISLEINLETPAEEGSYFGSWQLQNEIGEKIYTVWVDITVFGEPQSHIYLKPSKMVF